LTGCWSGGRSVPDPATPNGARDGMLATRAPCMGVAELVRRVAGGNTVYYDGVHTLLLRAVDLLGNVGAIHAYAVRIDSVGPTTRALRSALVRRGRKVTLRYRVDDTLSPSAKVTIRIKTLRGRTVKTLRAVTRTTNVAASSRFTCKLKKGRYRFFVYARDLAGNAQVRRGYGGLRVR
jgi:hypothetical protein